jgi:hypothetical protein
VRSGTQPAPDFWLLQTGAKTPVAWLFGRLYNTRNADTIACAIIVVAQFNNTPNLRLNGCRCRML